LEEKLEKGKEVVTEGEKNPPFHSPISSLPPFHAILLILVLILLTFSPPISTRELLFPFLDITDYGIPFQSCRVRQWIHRLVILDLQQLGVDSEPYDS
jgi:hypothetical protein